MSESIDWGDWEAEQAARRETAAKLAAPISNDRQFQALVERALLTYMAGLTGYRTNPRASRYYAHERATVVRGASQVILELVGIINHPGATQIADELQRIADEYERSAGDIPKTKPRADFRRSTARAVVSALLSVGVKPTAHSSVYGRSSDAVSLLTSIAQAAGDSELTRESARKLIATALRNSEDSLVKRQK